MCDNCRAYNSPDTEYVACANKMHAFLNARLRDVQQAAAGSALEGNPPPTAAVAALADSAVGLGGTSASAEGAAADAVSSA